MTGRSQFLRSAIGSMAIIAISGYGVTPREAHLPDHRASQAALMTARRVVSGDGMLKGVGRRAFCQAGGHGPPAPRLTATTDRSPGVGSSG